MYRRGRGIFPVGYRMNHCQPRGLPGGQVAAATIAAGFNLGKTNPPPTSTPNGPRGWEAHARGVVRGLTPTSPHGPPLRLCYSFRFGH